MLLTLALGALGLAVAALVLAIVPGRSEQGGVAGALAKIEHSYTRRPSGSGNGSSLLAALPGWPRALALRLSPSGIAAALQRRLDVAGNPAGLTPDRMLAVKGLGLVVLAFLGALVGLHNLGLLILWAVLLGAAGFFLPDVLLLNSAQKRQAKIQKEIADALDMLTVCVEAGLGFDAALAQVARNTEGALAAEFARVLQEMQIGKSRTEALRALVDRSTVPELRAFVSALIQAGELGIPVAQVLREQAREMRVRRRQRAEEKAQKLPVKILFPMVFCMFPAMFVVIIGPAVITISHTLLGPHGLLGHR